jgi:hypothetical protein
VSARDAIGLACACVLLAGCFGSLQPATATYQGVLRPVLLGPVDRIGGGPALPTERIASYEGEASAHFARSETQTHVTESQGFDNLTMVVVAVEKLEKVGPSGDIRITQLRAWARGYISFIKNEVRIQGTVVSVGRAP